MSDAKRAAPDWERIEADYRAGVLSLREIAAQHGISEGAIRKRAKRDDWVRDLGKRIQDKAQALVRTEEVRSTVRTETPLSERVLVDANATIVANIQLSQRRDIARAMRLTMAFFEELEQPLSVPEEGEDAPEPPSLQSRASTVRSLTESLKTLVVLQRQAYRMDEVDSEDPERAFTGIVRKIVGQST